MKKGKLIAIEGIDGVGKATQASLLTRHIFAEKGVCGLFSFPRYTTPTGKLVASYLKGEMGIMSIEQRTKLYADDRLAAKEEINAYINNGHDVVCDRYVHSNAAFFTALAKLEGKTPDEVQKIEEHIFHSEFVVNDLPQIDKLIVLTLPSHLSEKLVLAKAPRDYTPQKKDIHEQKIELQNLANAYYNRFTDSVIHCNNEEQIKPMEQIHQLVVSKYLELFDIGR